MYPVKRKVWDDHSIQIELGSDTERPQRILMVQPDFRSGDIDIFLYPPGDNLMMAIFRLGVVETREIAAALMTVADVVESRILAGPHEEEDANVHASP